MFQIYLVSAHGHRRIPEFLAGPDVRITLICCSHNVLKKSDFVDEVIVISDHKRCETFISKFLKNRELIESLDGWILFSGDEEMYQIANSNLSTELKLKLLPVRNANALKILGSKSGMVELANETGIKMPRSLTANSHEELLEHAKTYASAFLVKGSRGSGGTSVKKFETVTSLVNDPIPEEWFPVIIQEFVEGNERSIEALFNNGKLLAWMYADQIVYLRNKIGPTSSRRYRTPPLMDFHDVLIKFGEVTKAHGFGSMAFMYSIKDKQHYLVEADLRTNDWLNFGRIFGINWTEVMRANSPQSEKYPHILSEDGFYIRMWQREMEQALYDHDWRLAYSLLKIKRSDRHPHIYQDVSVNRALKLRLFRLLPLALAKTALALLPKSVERKLRERGIASKIGSQIAGG
ncbi:MAG: ATP-grasp domain-containing protein [Actinomycetota bacterium]